jgi:hypothetical protein
MKRKICENDVFRTSDLSLAATIYLFTPLVGIDKQNPHRSEFLFARNAELDRLIEAYWRREMRIDPKAYFDALRAIKARLYDC